MQSNWADDCDDINELKVKNRKRVKTAKHKTKATMIKSVQSGDWLDDMHMDAGSIITFILPISFLVWFV